MDSESMTADTRSLSARTEETRTAATLTIGPGGIREERGPGPTPGNDDVALEGTRRSARSGGKALAVDRLIESDGESTPLGPGVHLGRYTVLHVLGEGGMGVVCAAYDAMLDRKVALKLLRFRTRERAGKRLLREARAIARLSHPNIVSVYDAGQIGDELFVAMEYIEGQTLRQWQREERPWTEVLDVYIRAGRGLAAAHQAGVIHRDFKPDNVLVGDDGRVRVVDFGLAAPLEESIGDSAGSGEVDFPGDGTSSSDESHGSYESHDLAGSSAFDTPGLADGMSNPFDVRLTATGALLGTPAYMSPEQHLGEPTDARSDQFAFCVALFEGLHGKRAFRGGDVRRLSAVKLAGRVREVPDDSPVPAQVQAIVRRGLSREADQRWSSMEDILAALQRQRQPRRRWLAPALATAITLGSVVGYGAWSVDEPDRCPAPDEGPGEIWNEDSRRDIAAAFDELGGRNGETSWQRFRQRVDEYAEAWDEMHIHTCRATRVHGMQSAADLDSRMACLDERLVELDTLLAAFEEPSANLVARAPTALASLTPVARCADAGWVMRRAMPGDPATVARIRAASREHQAIFVRATLGMYSQALEQTEVLLEEIETIGYKPLLCHALWTRGRTRTRVGDLDGAESDLKQAYQIAVESGSSSVAFRAATQLVWVIGVERRRDSEALHWVFQADSWKAQDGTGELIDQIDHLQAVGMFYGLIGRFDESLEYQERTVGLIEQIHGEDSARMASTLNNIGFVHSDMRAYHRALDHFERSYAVWVGVGGPEHPAAGQTLLNIGRTHHQLEDYDRALEVNQQVFELWTGMKKPNPIDLGLAHVNLADTLTAVGRHESAVPLHERAYELLEGAVGPDHPFTAAALVGKGKSALLRGGGEDAVGHLERALAIHTSKATAPLEVADTRWWLARAVWQAGEDRARARALAEKARATLVAHDRHDQANAVKTWLEERTGSLALSR